jgi:anti-sigma28 factor (negative regulator of flagellin synthesis)
MMEIGPLSNQQSGQRPEGPKKHDPEKTQSEPAPGGGDRVEISPDARARLARQADLELKKQESNPGPINDQDLTGDERLEAIRRRIESGFYDQIDIKGLIAGKLVDDMDI